MTIGGTGRVHYGNRKASHPSGQLRLRLTFCPCYPSEWVSLDLARVDFVLRSADGACWSGMPLISWLKKNVADLWQAMKGSGQEGPRHLHSHAIGQNECTARLSGEWGVQSFPGRHSGCLGMATPLNAGHSAYQEEHMAVGRPRKGWRTRGPCSELEPLC